MQIILTIKNRTLWWMWCLCRIIRSSLSMDWKMCRKEQQIVILCICFKYVHFPNIYNTFLCKNFMINILCNFFKNQKKKFEFKTNWIEYNKPNKKKNIELPILVKLLFLKKILLNLKYNKKELGLNWIHIDVNQNQCLKQLYLCFMDYVRTLIMEHILLRKWLRLDF